MAYLAVGSMLTGVLIIITRLLQPYELVSCLLATVGAALLYTMGIDSSKARYIGPRVIFGLGIRLGNQVPMTALQSFATPEHIAPTTGVMLSKLPTSLSLSPLYPSYLKFTKLTCASFSVHKRRVLHNSRAISLRQPHALNSCKQIPHHRSNPGPYH
jgi:hypothetical protein